MKQFKGTLGSSSIHANLNSAVTETARNSDTILLKNVDNIVKTQKYWFHQAKVDFTSNKHWYKLFPTQILESYKNDLNLTLDKWYVLQSCREYSAIFYLKSLWVCSSYIMSWRTIHGPCYMCTAYVAYTLPLDFYKLHIARNKWHMFSEWTYDFGIEL